MVLEDAFSVHNRAQRWIYNTVKLIPEVFCDVFCGLMCLKISCLRLWACGCCCVCSLSRKYNTEHLNKVWCLLGIL